MLEQVNLAAPPDRPSPWLQRFVHLLKPGGSVLDVACGSGRHLRWLASQGFAVTGVDRDAAALASLAGVGELIAADIENAPWPVPARSFDAVLVTNYLWRPLWPALRGALAEGGVLVCETFADGQQRIGRPTRPEFLLQPGELWKACEGLRVVAFEDGFDGARFVQRIVAVDEGPGGAPAAGYGLVAQGSTSAVRPPGPAS